MASILQSNQGLSNHVLVSSVLLQHGRVLHLSFYEMSPCPDSGDKQPSRKASRRTANKATISRQALGEGSQEHPKPRYHPPDQLTKRHLACREHVPGDLGWPPRFNRFRRLMYKPHRQRAKLTPQDTILQQHNQTFVFSKADSSLICLRQ